MSNSFAIMAKLPAPGAWPEDTTESSCGPAAEPVKHDCQTNANESMSGSHHKPRLGTTTSMSKSIAIMAERSAPGAWPKDDPSHLFVVAGTIRHPRSGHHLVRILVDPRAPHNVCSDTLARRLHLNPSHAELDLNGCVEVIKYSTGFMEQPEYDFVLGWSWIEKHQPLYSLTTRALAITDVDGDIELRCTTPIIPDRRMPTNSSGIDASGLHAPSSKEYEVPSKASSPLRGGRLSALKRHRTSHSHLAQSSCYRLSRVAAAHQRTTALLRTLRKAEMVKAQRQKRHIQPVDLVLRSDPQYLRHAIKPAREYARSVRAYRRDFHRGEFFTFRHANDFYKRARAMASAYATPDDPDLSPVNLCTLWAMLVDRHLKANVEHVPSPAQLHSASPSVMKSSGSPRAASPAAGTTSTHSATSTPAGKNVPSTQSASPYTADSMHSTSTASTLDDICEFLWASYDLLKVTVLSYSPILILLALLLWALFDNTLRDMTTFFAVDQLSAVISSIIVEGLCMVKNMVTTKSRSRKVHLSSSLIAENPRGEADTARPSADGGSAVHLALHPSSLHALSTTLSTVSANSSVEQPQVGASKDFAPTPDDRHPQRGNHLVIMGTVRTKSGETVEARCLVDGGSYVNSCHVDFARYLDQTILSAPEPMRYANDHIGVAVTAVHTELQLAGQVDTLDCFVTHTCSSYDIVLGQPWHARHNPSFSNNCSTVDFTARGSSHRLRCKGIESSTAAQSTSGLYATRASKRTKKTANPAERPAGVKKLKKPPKAVANLKSGLGGRKLAQGKQAIAADPAGQGLQKAPIEAPAEADLEPTAPASTGPELWDDVIFPPVADPILATDSRIEAFLNAMSGCKTKGNVNYTPDAVQPQPLVYRPIGPVMHLQDFPIVDNRSFKLANLGTFETVVGRPAEVVSWTLRVRDINRSDSPILTLYEYGKMTGSKGRLEAPDGPIDTRWCATRDEAEALGEVCCNLLNRLPCPLQEGIWANVRASTGPIYPRKMIETLALDVWKPGFDYRSLFHLFEHDELVKAGPAYTKDVPWFRLTGTMPFCGKAQHDLILPIATSHFGQTLPETSVRTRHLGKQITNRLLLRIPTGKLNYAKIEEALPKIPATFCQVPISLPLNLSPFSELSAQNQKTLRKLVEWMCYETVGRVGTREQLQSHIVSKLLPFCQDNRAEGTGTGTGGPCDGNSLVKRGTRGQWLTASTSQNFAATITKGLPRIRLPSTRLNLGHGINAGLQALRDGSNAAQIWYAVLLSIVAAETRLDSPARILEVQCNCATASDKKQNVHACMLCANVVRCEDLIEALDDRLVCSSHSAQDYELPFDSNYKPPTSWTPPEDLQAAILRAGSDPGTVPGKAARTVPSKAARTVKPGGFLSQRGFFSSFSPTARVERLMRSVFALANKENKVGASLTMQHMEEVRNFLETSLPETGEWQDAYDGPQLESTAQYDGAAAAAIAEMRPATRPTHPDSSSLDAVLPFWLEGLVCFIHHPSNLALTTYFINHVKGYWPPSILPLMRAAAVQAKFEKQRVEQDGVSLSKVRDVDFWAKVLVGADHIHRITTCYSSVKKTRLGHRLSTTEFSAYVKAWRTGRWTPDLRPFAPRARAFETAADHANLTGGNRESSLRYKTLSKARKDLIPADKEFSKVWAPFTKEQKFRYSKIIQGMRVDTAKFNPNDIGIKTSKDGAPWPFPVKYYPDQEDDLWDWWFRFALDHYHSMDDICDLENLTQESPATIVLFFVERYFAIGGGFDELLHCDWVPWTKHPFVASIGRSALANAGTILRTGWISIDPSSLADFRPEQRTATVQCWIVNKAMHNYPICMHDSLLDRLVNIAEQCLFYDAPASDLEDLRDSFPHQSRASRVRKRKAAKASNQQVSSDEADVENSGEEEEEEEEEEEVELLFDGINDKIPDAENDSSSTAANKPAQQPISTTTTLLNQLEQELHASHPGWMHSSLAEYSGSRLVSAAEKEDAPSFASLADEFRRVIRQEGIDKSGPAARQCVVCQQTILEDPVFCKTPGHDGQRMHWRCAKATSPEDFNVLCPGCCRAPASAAGSLTDPLPSIKIMPNLGTTCFLNAPVQILYHSKDFRDFFTNEANEVAHEDGQSGRLLREWLPPGYGWTTGSTEQQTDILSRKLRSKATAMFRSMRGLFRRLGDSGGSITSREMEEVFNTVNALDPVEFGRGIQCESGDLLNRVIDTGIYVSDTSTFIERPACIVEEQEIERLPKDMPPLPPLILDSAAAYDSFTRAGRQSKLFAAVCCQFACEYMCEVCHLVRRRFEHPTHLLLNFTYGNEGDHTLMDMLREWNVEMIDSDNRRKCSTNIASHRSADRIVRKLTMAPKFLFLRFMRGNGQHENHVDLPEFIDIATCANAESLPSDGSVPADLNLDTIYRLHAVSVFYPHGRAGGHYIPFIDIDGYWTRLDDINPPAVREHPQVAFSDAEGGMASFVMYVQQKGRKSLPLDSNNHSTTGFMLRKNGAVPSPMVETPRWIADDAAVYQCHVCEDARFTKPDELEEHTTSKHSNAEASRTELQRFGEDAESARRQEAQRKQAEELKERSELEERTRDAGQERSSENLEQQWELLRNGQAKLAQDRAHLSRQRREFHVKAIKTLEFLRCPQQAECEQRFAEVGKLQTELGHAQIALDQARSALQQTDTQIVLQRQAILAIDEGSDD